MTRFRAAPKTARMFPIRDHNPSSRRPVVTFVLIALNVAVFLWGLAAVTSQQAEYQLYYNWAMIPARISYGENWISLLSSIFLHGGFWHIAGNMLFLWIFGDNLEDQMGHLGFALFYLACGVGANLAEVVAAPWSPVPTIGASGAIAGVMGGYLLLFPKAKVDVLVFIVVFVRIFTMPAALMLGLWFAIQLFSGLAGQGGQGGGVAYWAHAGGFVCGIALALPVFLWRGGARFWGRTHGVPPHPETRYPFQSSNVPRVGRRR